MDATLPASLLPLSSYLPHILVSPISVPSDSTFVPQKTSVNQQENPAAPSPVTKTIPVKSVSRVIVVIVRVVL